jgi:GT2 family glycosyltransferase
MVRVEDRRVSAQQIHRSTDGSELDPRLAVILVNYNGWADVVRLVTALVAEPEFAAGVLQVVIVDNASPEPIPQDFMRSPPPGLSLLLRPDNGGFAVGVNAGWRLARSPWLLVLNPDVEIEKGLIGQVIERIEHHERQPTGLPGIVGFGLRNADGSKQGSVGVFPSLFRTIREQFIPRSRRKYQAGWRIRSGPVDWVTGACMLVNARMIADLGGMDEDFFLYYEEVAFSRSAQDRGWRVEYDPSIEVIHRHPLQNRPVSPRMRVITRHSKLLYFRKHLPAWQFRWLSWIVTGEATIRGLGAWVRGRSQERRAWKTIGEVSFRLRAGQKIGGREILQLAETADREPPALSADRADAEPELNRALSSSTTSVQQAPAAGPALSEDRQYCGPSPDR